MRYRYGLTFAIITVWAAAVVIVFVVGALLLMARTDGILPAIATLVILSPILAIGALTAWTAWERE